MSEALVLEFDDVTAAQYDEVNRYLGIDPRTGEGEWPAGLQSHYGCSGARLMVFEIWESREAQRAFMEGRLGAALGKAGLPEPSHVEWMGLLGSHST